MSSPQVDFLSTPEGLGQLPQTPTPVFIKPQRSMGGFVADAVIEEEHNDELVITDHPVEQGSVISDHAYARPSWVRLIYGWSGGSVQADNDPEFLKNLYRQIRDLRNSRVPFDVYTGKRKYENMLIQMLRVETNKDTENALIIHALCREVIIANTQTVSVSTASNSNPALQAQPQNTSNITNMGTQQLQPAPNFNPGE